MRLRRHIHNIIILSYKMHAQSVMCEWARVRAHLNLHLHEISCGRQANSQPASQTFGYTYNLVHIRCVCNCAPTAMTHHSSRKECVLSASMASKQSAESQSHWYCPFSLFDVCKTSMSNTINWHVYDVLLFWKSDGKPCSRPSFIHFSFYIFWFIQILLVSCNLCVAVLVARLRVLDSVFYFAAAAADAFNWCL